RQYRDLHFKNARSKKSGAASNPGAASLDVYRSREPGLLRKSFRFERADLVGVLERQRNVVVAVQQAFAPERIDVEAIRVRAVRRAHRLRLEVDRQLEAGKRLDRVEEAIDFILGEHDRQQSVLETVVEEDVGKRRRDQRSESEIEQCPRRVLARAAAAEISAR